MSTEQKFVELTHDMLKIILSNVRVTAYQFGTVGSCPTEIFWGIDPTVILECCINIDILYN